MVKHIGCTVPGCGGKHRAKGLCYAHYQRSYRGSPLGTGNTGAHIRATDHEDGTRTCSACAVRQEIENFYTSKGCARGRRSTCKPCTRSRDRSRRLSAPDVYAVLDRLSNIRRRARLAMVEFDPSVTVEALRARGGDECCYCGVTMVFGRGKRGSHPPAKASIEHVRPISRGGAHTFDNAALACLACNYSKNARTVDEWVRAT